MFREFPEIIPVYPNIVYNGDVKKCIRFSKFPVYLDFEEIAEDFIVTPGDFVAKLQLISTYQEFWRTSIERSMMQRRLRELKYTAPITNIVCISLGTLRSPDSILQHIVASDLAQQLTRLYEEDGIRLQKPITIVAQDPAYTAMDHETLSMLPVPIEVLPDPQGFLAINESSLVFSCRSVVPVKMMIAGLAFEAPDRKGPAALFLDYQRASEDPEDLDLVVYDWTQPLAKPDMESRHFVKMLASYAQVVDGKRLYGERFNHEYYSQKIWETPEKVTAEEWEVLELIWERMQRRGTRLRGMAGDDDKDSRTIVGGKRKDITKNLKGFDWLEIMDLWAREE